MIVKHNDLNTCLSTPSPSAFPFSLLSRWPAVSQEDALTQQLVFSNQSSKRWLTPKSSQMPQRPQCLIFHAILVDHSWVDLLLVCVISGSMRPLFPTLRLPRTQTMKLSTPETNMLERKLMK